MASLLELSAPGDNGSHLPHTSINKLCTTSNWPQYKVQLLPQITALITYLKSNLLFD